MRKSFLHGVAPRTSRSPNWKAALSGMAPDCRTNGNAHPRLSLAGNNVTVVTRCCPSIRRSGVIPPADITPSCTQTTEPVKCVSSWRFPTDRISSQSCSQCSSSHEYGRWYTGTTKRESELVISPMSDRADAFIAMLQLPLKQKAISRSETIVVQLCNCLREQCAFATLFRFGLSLFLVPHPCFRQGRSRPSGGGVMAASAYSLACAPLEKNEVSKAFPPRWRACPIASRKAPAYSAANHRLQSKSGKVGNFGVFGNAENSVPELRGKRVSSIPW